MLSGLLLLEASLVICFYVIPELRAQKYSPFGNWEMETPLHDSPGMDVGLVAFLGLFVLGNVGLMILVWRAFKDLVSDDWGLPK
jgi:hypothetical protein